jgi:hypothetical protein
MLEEVRAHRAREADDEPAENGDAE